jgi:hypothetical protein
MAYSDFTLRKVKQDFNLTISEQGTFILPTVSSVSPSSYFTEFFARNLRLATTLSTEKARSELIICPILLEVRELLQEKISLFSGEEFNVDPALGLNGTCDFIISHSPEQLFVESPVAVIVEAKKEDLKAGLGQCIAEMVAAQKFNENNNNTISSIYGIVTSGKLWKFLKLEEQTVMIDLEEYSIPPIEELLGILMSLVAI